MDDKKKTCILVAVFGFKTVCLSFSPGVRAMRGLDALAAELSARDGVAANTAKMEKISVMVNNLFMTHLRKRGPRRRPQQHPDFDGLVIL